MKEEIYFMVRVEGKSWKLELEPELNIWEIIKNNLNQTINIFLWLLFIGFHSFCSIFCGTTVNIVQYNVEVVFVDCKKANTFQSSFIWNKYKVQYSIKCKSTIQQRLYINVYSVQCTRTAINFDSIWHY